MKGPTRARAVLARLASVGPEGVMGRVGWAGAVEVMQLVSSVVVFLALADLLTRDDYAQLQAIQGLALPAAGLASLGSHILLIQRVSRGQPLTEAWPRATSIGILGPAVGALVVIAIQPITNPALDRGPVILLVLAQVNFFWLGELAVYVGNATGRLREAAQIRFLLMVCRLVALGWFALWGGTRLVNWAAASMVSFAVGAALAVGYIWRVFGARPSLARGRMDDVREGAPFSVNAVSENLVSVSDQPLLERYGHRDDLAVYGLGVRITQFGYMPQRMLMRASDANLFRAGKDGTVAALGVTRALLGPSVAVNVAVGVGMVAVSPLLPYLTPRYGDLPPVLRLLAVLPLVRGLQWLVGNTLSASGHQKGRVVCTWTAVVVNLGLNLALLPTGTWRTAVFTTMVTEVYLLAALTVVVLVWARREKAHRQPNGA